MRANEALRQMHANTHRRLREELQGLTPEQLTWSPRHEANPIGFLAWHVARVEDLKVSRLLRHGWKTGDSFQLLGEDAEEIWIKTGAPQRMGYTRPGYGFGFDHVQVHSVPVENLEAILAYLDSVVEQTQAVLSELPEDRVEAVVGIGLISHTLGHLGAIQYLKGLQDIAASPAGT